VKAIQNSGVPLVGAFVGNKCEFRDGSIDSRAEVDILEAKETAESLGMTYFETSAVSRVLSCCFLLCIKLHACTYAIFSQAICSVYLLTFVLFNQKANNIGVDAPFQYIAEEFYRRLGLPLP